VIHIIQSDPEVPVGIVGTELQRCGVELSVVRVYDGEQLPGLSAVAGAIVLGGAMGANDDARHPFLTDLKRFIGALVEQKIPLLGICLGGQLLSVARGGVVTSNSNGEKVTCAIMLTGEGEQDRLLRGLGPGFVSFQWHNDSFSIPKQGIRLAFTETCHNQAFRIGPRAWGLQFHPEVNREIVREWSSKTSETAANVEEFVAAFQERENDYRAVSRQLVENFVEIAGLISRAP
jgi:GMP synthase-like glutamine amidotransferase